MPLLERQPVDLIPLPELPGTHHGEVWQIRFTGEIFLSYEDYYARYNFLRKRHFTCSKTGRTDLSYEDALASEREATRRMEENFPEPWRRPALQLIHYSLDRLNPLVERLYEYFKDRIFIDEYVYIAVEGTFALAKVLEIVPVESGTGADSVEVLYRVNLVDPENELLTSQDVDGDLPVEYLLPAQELKRDRTELSKQRFRKFVRDVANKEPWIGAPWVVRPDLLKRYQIHDIIPPLVADLLEERHRKLVGDVVRDKDVDGQEPTNYHKNSKKKGLKIKEDAAAPAQAKIRVNVKFPIDDLDVLEIATYSKKQLQFKRPPLQREFGKFPISHCTMLLEVWMFICIYNKPLDLQLISLDDFIEVLEFDTSHERLMPEVFGTFLNIACKDWGGSVETGNMFAKSSDTQDLEGRRFSPYDADTQLEMHHYLQIYQELTSDEQASIDQWWKWEPGRWAQQSHSAQKSTSSAANSLKAWEIVLAGVLRDWIPASRYPRKWGTLCQLLKGVLGESRQSSPSKDREDNQNDVDVDIEGDTSLAGSPAPFVAEESIEHEWSSLDVDTGASRRSGLRKRTRKEQDEEHNSDQSVPTGSRISTRNKRKVAKFIPESAPAAKITPTTSPSSRAKSRKKKEEKKLAFDRLCQSAAAGFESLTAVERLELLAIIMEVCVGPSSIVRQYIEDCKEKSLELKKDKREMARERKELNAARADFDGREREASPSHSVDSPATDANSVTSTVRIDGESGSSDETRVGGPLVQPPVFRS
ncbi:ATP-utilizing chromatin assembly and remodelling N-terminal-domain-containing protein [Phlyctochytrium arcticum]|nr:ATP-utilizing chromatin assembly and remodelling N-terminal-domain-containing protein [Phlyctochytrium arcticum]